MRKIYTTSEYKQRNTVKSNKVITAFTRSNCRKKRVAANIHRKNLETRPLIAYTIKPRHKLERKQRTKLERRKRNVIKEVPAPAVFSLLQNEDPESFILFINKLRQYNQQRQKIKLVMRDTKFISNDAIVILLSIISEFKHNGVYFTGDIPEDKEVREVWFQSGFFDHMDKNFQFEKKTKNSIKTHNKKRVESSLTSELIGQAAETIWGQKRRCCGVQRTLIECMGNTFDHAWYTRDKRDCWFLSVSHHEDANRVSFAFVDLGVGIFESIKLKKFSGRLKDFLNRVRGKYNNNAELLKLILIGEHKPRTRSGEKHRGRGLPGIYKAMERNQLSNLAIVSNDVFANFADEKFAVINNKFSGTFLYWELNTENDSLEWI